MHSERYTSLETFIEKEPNAFQESVQVLSEKIKRALRTHIGFNKNGDSDPVENKNTNERWIKKGFSIENEMKHKHGPLMEIGGPTLGGFELVNFDSFDKDKKIFVSNITPGRSLYDGISGQFLGYTGKIDFMADAQKLPFRDGEIGALFASRLPIEIREKVIHEAKRVLEENGLLVWQGGREEDMKSAERVGFQLVEYSKKLYGSVYNWNVIFQKKI